MSFPIPASGLSVVTPRLWSLRLFYQQPGGPIGQTEHLDGKWDQYKPAFTTVPLSPLASITWDEEKEIRVYCLDSDYILQEHCYSASKGWYVGDLGAKKLKATPLSRLAAIVFDYDGARRIRVYFQEDGSHAVKEICNDGGGWFFGLMKIGDAVEGTGLAAITYFGQIRVYYQTFEELYLKENCWNLKAWVPGEFNPGKAPLGTPIAAVGFGNYQAQVFWRDSNGHIAGQRWTTSWNPIKVIPGIGPGFGFTVLQWELGKYYRLYYEDYNNLLFEYCSDDGGITWYAGQKLSQ